MSLFALFPSQRKGYLFRSGRDSNYYSDLFQCEDTPLTGTSVGFYPSQIQASHEFDSREPRNMSIPVDTVSKYIVTATPFRLAGGYPEMIQ